MKLVKLFLSNLLLIALLSLSGCFETNKDVCERRLPEVEKEIREALLVLDPSDWVDAKFPDPQFSPIPVSMSSDRKWHEWSMKQLRLTQKYLDLLGPARSLDKAEIELSIAAQKWVEFYSYAKQENLVKMVRTLKVIQGHLTRTKEITCQALHKK
jgi:hypothetical protein